MDCKHLNFRSSVAIGRILQKDGDVDPAAFVADIRIKCVDCDEPFEFYGVPMGWTAMHPTSSVDGLELHVPLKPKSSPMPLASTLMSYSVKQVI